ncbi:Transcription cofactor vestigial-like protein 4, partial [Frankliniella fusca]
CYPLVVNLLYRLSFASEEARKSLPSVRWRRDRRARDSLPDYVTAKATSGGQQQQQQQQGADAPLDMSTRRVVARTAPEPKPQALSLARKVPSPTPASPAAATGRGSPPSYSEAISKPGYRLPLARPSVITCAPPSPTLLKESDKPGKANKSTKVSESLSGDGMCDPVIDEHFRRSLGKDYLTLFAKKTVSSKPNGYEEEENNGPSITGLSVDDHFAKALGDTWLKLQKDSSPSSLPSVPSKPASKETSNSSIPRQRRGLVTI